MIGLDTSVIVRFLAQDDDRQSPIASRLFSKLTRVDPGFVSSVVLAEVSWVLTRSYRMSRDALSETIEGLLRSTELRFENAGPAWRALGLFRSGEAIGFADALISETGALAGVRETYTFERTGAAEGGMKLLA